MIKAIIVEDDLMVAEINRQFIAKIKEIQVIQIFYTGKEALSFIKNNTVDLILLDMYLPDINGIELLTELRKYNLSTDVIMITAASDPQHISEALHLGIVDYLIKPFQYERFEESMMGYLNRKKSLTQGTSISQEFLDENIFVPKGKKSNENLELKKGIQNQTLELIVKCMASNTNNYLTSNQIADAVSLSNVTVRKYLNYMVEQNMIECKVDYDTGGRPSDRYTLL